jgi:SAM-dependent methyltransferase
MHSVCEELKFDHDFYRLSYPDLVGHGIQDARNHFINHGLQEGRFCSSYHVLKEHYPEFAGAFDWRGLKFPHENQKTPLELTLLLKKSLLCGFPSSLDLQSSDISRIPVIAKHGKLFEYLSLQYNHPRYKVLEIGSRAVCSNSTWKHYIPNCSYVGFDVMEGLNVNVTGDAHKLSSYFERNSFDAVVSFAVFEHLAMPWVVAEEISKILKVGGTLAIETHFSFSEHELPWHFFQFNANGLEVLFNKDLGFETLDKGMDNPVIGRFSVSATEYLKGQLVTNLFCHSSLLAKKVSNGKIHDRLDWRSALPGALNETMYPSNTSRF